MKRSYLLLFLLLSVVFFEVKGQDSESDGFKAIDNDEILREIINSESPNYYPVLFTRYMAGDTTLTLSDYRYLYYGYVWQTTYKPFETPEATTKILMILEKQKDFTQSDFENIVKYANDVMISEPFNPSNINFLTFAYASLGDKVNEKINSIRMNMIFKTIQSSGTGLKEHSAWHIIAFSHATDLLAHMNLSYGKPVVESRTVEYIPLLIRTKGVKGYYFDYSRIYWYKPDNIPLKENNGWEFNGIPLKRRVLPK